MAGYERKGGVKPAKRTPKSKARKYNPNPPKLIAVKAPKRKKK